MKLEFDVKVDAGMLYDFLLRHTYTSAQGLIGTCVGALFIVGFAMQPGRYAALVVGLIILIYLPISLSLKAKAQALNPVFRRPIHYTMTEEGVMVSQEADEEQTEGEEPAESDPDPAETAEAEETAEEEAPAESDADPAKTAEAEETGEEEAPAESDPDSAETAEDEEQEDTSPKPFPWDAMYKAVSTKNSIILYTTRVNACIFPRKQLGGHTTDVIKMIATHMPPKKVKIRY